MGMKNDLVTLTLDINANFSSLFDWNTKELFVYLYANYTSKRNVSLYMH